MIVAAIYSDNPRPKCPTASADSKLNNSSALVLSLTSPLLVIPPQTQSLRLETWKSPVSPPPPHTPLLFTHQISQILPPQGLSSWFPPPCPSYHLPLPVFLAVGLCSFLTVPYTPATHGCVYVPPRHSAVFTALNPVSCSSICLASAGSPFASLKLSLPRWNVFLLHPPSHCSRGFITGRLPCSSCSAESCLAQSRSDSNGVRLLVLQICCPRSLRGVTAPTATSALPSLESQLANITGKTPSTSRAQGVH